MKTKDALEFTTTVERWGVFELSLRAEPVGNPFVDSAFHATFTGSHEQKTVSGFYDGDGIFKVRFMPSFEDSYQFETAGNFPGANTSGSFTVTESASNNRGMVRVRGFHFEYEDGTPFYPIGTTCYVWNLQEEAIREQTLATLAQGYFNKIRFCVFPKHYLYNLHEPVTYPYEGSPCVFTWDGCGSFYNQMSVQPGNDWDFTRFNPAHFRLVEDCIVRLGEIGIEADLILFHPYDRWGFSQMSPQQDELYLRYTLARFSAYRNVWWSLANEYDLMRTKSIADWERIADIIVESDPYFHLRSIHNCMPMFDYTRPWITHCSIQRQDLYKCAEYTADFRVRYGKPVVLDEIAYEGDIDQGWGNITAQEMVRRFWEAAMRGGYASHGETYERPDGLLWWSHGKQLHGESPARLAFLHSILCQTPGHGLRMAQGSWDEVAATAEGLDASGYHLYYYGFGRPFRRLFNMPPGERYKAEVIDTWEMTITDAGEHSGIFSIPLPRKQWMAIRLTRIV
ncbi:MAG: DUF5605 domain-containing protein [Christensenellales bacterium]|jgi:hypothetical protein